MTYLEAEEAYEKQLPVKYRVITIGEMVYPRIDALIKRRNEAGLTSMYAELKPQNGARGITIVPVGQLKLAEGGEN